MPWCHVCRLRNSECHTHAPQAIGAGVGAKGRHRMEVEENGAGSSAMVVEEDGVGFSTI